jgi:hypothetical protein
VTTVAAPPSVRPRPAPSGSTRAHVSPVLIFAGITAVFVVIVGIGAIVTAIVKPTPQLPCPKVVTCLNAGLHHGPDLTATYTNTQLGYSFRYPANIDTVTVSNGAVYVSDSGSTMVINVYPASVKNADTAYNDQYNSEAGRLSFDSVDTTSIFRIQAPSIGFVPGVGGSYWASDGVQTWNDAILAASDGHLTVSIELAIKTNLFSTVENRRNDQATLILDSFKWHS